MFVRRYNSRHDVEKDETSERAISKESSMSASQLWLEFKQGSEKAYALIYKENAELLYSYGMKLVQDQELVMDAVQDLFIDIWDSRARLGEVQSIKSYLIKSLRRRVLQQKSRDNKNTSLSYLEGEVGESSPSVEHKLIEKQIREIELKQLNTALSGLKKDQQEIIYLKYHGRLSYEEIAQVMATDKKSVYNAMARAVKLLREVMKPLILLFLFMA